MPGTAFLKRGFSLAVLFLAFGSLLVKSQVPDHPSLIRGRVLDSNRAAIAGARITAHGSHSNFSTATDSNGDFSLVLPPGDYTLMVTAEGFAAASHTVKLKSAAPDSLEIVLQPAGTTATVTIMGADTLGYRAQELSSATKTSTPLRDVPVDHRSHQRPD